MRLIAAFLIYLGLCFMADGISKRLDNIDTDLVKILQVLERQK